MDFQSLLGGHVDALVESCKVGLRKPDPRIYELICERLGAVPSRVVYLDDIGVRHDRAGLRALVVVD